MHIGVGFGLEARCRAWKVQRRVQSAGCRVQGAESVQSAGCRVRMAAWKVHVGKTAVGVNAGRQGRKEGRREGILDTHTRTCVTG